MTALSKIVATHVADVHGTDDVDLAFARLGAFLDTEADSLETVGSVLRIPGIGRTILALQALHRGPDIQDRMVLASARDLLAWLRTTLLSVPTQAPGCGSSDLDGAVRYLGARVEDQIIGLDRLLG